LIRPSARALAALLVGASAIAVLTCQRSPPAPAAPVEKHPGWRFKTETQWIVATTAESVVALASYASGRPEVGPFVAQVTERPAPAGRHGYTLRFASALALGPHNVDVADYVWSPTAYMPLAALVLPAQRTAALAGANPSGLLQALVNLRPETLVAESRRVSAALEASPLDASFHAEAAFLLGAFTLREAAGAYSDTRVPLCRMAAHLALAQALRGSAPPGSVEVLAEVMLLGGVGRQKDAVARLDAFRPLAPAEETWARALRMAITGDWRALTKPERATLLERLVYVRAIAERLDQQRAFDFVARGPVERLADWRRILNQAPPSVENCNTFYESGSRDELSEALAVWKAYRGAELDSELVLEALDGEPAASSIATEDGARRVSVLDLGLWRAFEMRHLLAQLGSDQYCVQEMWGWPEQQRRAILQELERRFARLPLLSFVSVRYARDRDTYARASRSAAALLARAPERVPGTLWARFQGQSAFGSPPLEKPDYGDYFEPRIPPGTAFDVRARITQGATFHSEPATELLQELAELAPFELAAKWRLVIGHLGRKADHEQAARVFGPLVDYDIEALEGVVEAAMDHPEACGPLAERMCALRIDDCAAYARWLVKEKKEDQAAVILRKWFAAARDRVAASNGAEWLVNYDYDHGERAEAFRIAREAAAVSSATGLMTLGGLFEKSGNLADAHAYFKRAAINTRCRACSSRSIQGMSTAAPGPRRGRTCCASTSPTGSRMPRWPSSSQRPATVRS
jgi:hypothetical protein